MMILILFLVMVCDDHERRDAYDGAHNGEGVVVMAKAIVMRVATIIHI